VQPSQPYAPRIGLTEVANVHRAGIERQAMLDLVDHDVAEALEALACADVDHATRLLEAIRERCSNGGYVRSHDQLRLDIETDQRHCPRVAR